MKNRTKKDFGVAAALLVSGSLLPSVAHAQVGASEDEGSGNVIVVTARKVEESLLETPLAVTAFSETDLERQNIVALEDLASLTPALSFQDLNGAYQNPSIRGLTQTNQISAQGNVGVFLDGVFLNNRSALEFGAVDLARIEVVKGPQSALYGRNTFGGAINYVTRTPELGEFSGRIKGELGSHDKYSLSGQVNIPIGDVAVVQLFGGFSEFDGTIDNSAGRFDDRLGGYKDRDAFGGKIYIKPSDEFTMTFFGMRGIIKNDAPALALTDAGVNNAGSPTVGGFAGTGRNLFTAFEGEFPKLDAVRNFSAVGLIAETDLFYGKLEYDFGFATLSTLVSHINTKADLDVDIVSDPDAVNQLFFGNFSRQSFLDASTPLGNAESYEVRLRGNGDGPLDWGIGAYYFDSLDETTLAISFAQVGMPDAPLLDFFRSTERLRTKAISVFGNVGYQLTDRLSAGAEVRYTSESIDLLNGLPGESQDFNFVVPRFTLEYQANNDLLIYANAGRGLKTGGFNNNPATVGNQFRTFQEESNWSFELGAKGIFFDDLLQLTTAVWYVDWNDVQVQTNIPGTTTGVTVNSGKIISKGIELDALFNVTDNFTIRLAGAVLDPEYGDGFIDGELVAPCGELLGTTITNPGCTADVSGNQVSRTSDFQFSVSANYVVPELIGDFDGYARIDYSYEAGKFSTGLNLNNQGDISLANIRVGLNSDMYEISFYVDNVFDKKWTRRITPVGNSQEGSPASGVLQYRRYPGQRRTYGMNVSVAF